MPHLVDLPQPPEVLPAKRNAHDLRVIQNVTLFGDSAIQPDHPEYKKVYSLAQKLGKKGFSIVNGGGPGVMEAATSGAESVGGKTIAIYWEPKLASHFEGKTVTTTPDQSKAYSNYMIRTLGLIETGHVFVACQGGTGTVSEFGMVWALAKLYFGRHKPVILFGDFWHKVVDSFAENMLIDDEELGVLYFASTPQEVIDLIEGFELEIKSRQLQMAEGDESGFVLDGRNKLTARTYDKVAKLYHEERAGHPVSEKQLDEFISLVKSGHVLDIGTGPGYDLAYLSKTFKKIDGIEASKEMAHIARFENPHAWIINKDVVDVELGQNKYRGIWSRDCLHHIPEVDQDRVFKKIADSLTPGGIFYLIVQKGEGEKFTEEKRNNYNMRRFYHYYTREELKSRGHKAGLEIVNMEQITRSHLWWAVIYRKKS